MTCKGLRNRMAKGQEGVSVAIRVCGERVIGNLMDSPRMVFTRPDSDVKRPKTITHESTRCFVMDFLRRIKIAFTPTRPLSRVGEAHAERKTKMFRSYASEKRQ